MPRDFQGGKKCEISAENHRKSIRYLTGLKIRNSGYEKTAAECAALHLCMEWILLSQDGALSERGIFDILKAIPKW